MPFWNRRSDDGRKGSEGWSRLQAIERSTPHRYRVRLADATQRETAIVVLRDPRRIPLTFEVSDGPDGQVWLDIAAKGHDRGQSIVSVIYALKQAGVGVRDLEFLDLVEDLSESEFDRLIDAYDREVGGDRITRRRFERLGGRGVFDIALRRCLAAPQNSTYRIALHDIADNTPGCEPDLVRAAGEMDARSTPKLSLGNAADSLLTSATSRGALSRSVGLDVHYPEGPLFAMADRVYFPGSTAVAMLSVATNPLSDAATAKLCEIAAVDDEFRSHVALSGLHRARPSEAVHEAAEAGLRSSRGDTKAAALGLLSHHWPHEARSIWPEALASKSRTVRDAAEAIVARDGTVDDVPLAAQVVAKVIRAKPGMTYSPPRPSNLIDFLVRHRSEPAAQAAFADLAARWDSLPDPDLHDRVREHHPWIESFSATAAEMTRLDEPASVVAEAETLDRPYTVERTDDDPNLYQIDFDEDAAHDESDRVDRMARLIAADERVEKAFREDREFILATASVDPTTMTTIADAAWDAAV